MSERAGEKNQPDWDRLGRETLYSKHDWIAAAMHLGDLDWRALWPSVETLAHASGYAPIVAARMVRESLVSRPGGQ